MFATASAATLHAARPTPGRTERRLAHRSPCRVRMVDWHQDMIRSFVGETVNLSPRGMAVRLGVALHIGDAIEVLLPLGGEPQCMYGRVIHVRRITTGTFEVGIRIDTMLAVS